MKSAANWTTETVNAATEKVRATAADVGDSVVSYTRDNPIKALLISMTVGALIGTTFTASRRKRV